MIDQSERDLYSIRIERLHMLIKQLSQGNGSFRTFLYPKTRNDNQVFYSGEALLALAFILNQKRDEETIDWIRKSKKYYLNYYHSNNRNTAFIPWHTMAYWEMFNLTGDQSYRESIFELNDWLICLQDLGSETPMQIKGRFYLEALSQNGPPHASSTAVYVEGLSYAYNMAKSVGDDARSEAYLMAIRWGLRSLLQLQYRKVNSYYLQKRGRVLGGLRTTLTNNIMRIDNTQHSIMASLAAQRFLSPEDYSRKLPLATDHHKRMCSPFLSK